MMVYGIQKTAVAFLTDYRSGAIGRISLETPESRVVMMQESSPNTTDEIAAEISESDAT